MHAHATCRVAKDCIHGQRADATVVRPPLERTSLANRPDTVILYDHILMSRVCSLHDVSAFRLELASLANLEPWS